MGKNVDNNGSPDAMPTPKVTLTGIRQSCVHVHSLQVISMRELILGANADIASEWSKLSDVSFQLQRGSLGWYPIRCVLQYQIGVESVGLTTDGPLVDVTVGEQMV